MRLFLRLKTDSKNKGEEERGGGGGGGKGGGGEKWTAGEDCGPLYFNQFTNPLFIL